MRFRDDNRAVSVQIGAVLLFATLIIALSLYQATIVPSQNADVEYKHSQTVQNQMSDVRNGLLRTAGSGNSQPVSVALGTQYPSRVFLMNPPPATGTIRTGSYENATIQLSNVDATNEETHDFIAESWNASTKFLAYEPNYHEFDNPPSLRYESSILSNYYADVNNGTAIPLTEQLLVNNETKTITLVALNGSLSTTQAGSVSVNPETLSAPYQRVQVEKNDSADPAVLSVPTVISAAQLENRTALGSHPDVIDVRDHPTEADRVVIEVDWSGEFTFQTARVGVGSDTVEPPVHYLTVTEYGGGSVTVEARDRFNNPVSGVSVTGGASFEEPSRQTTETGRAKFDLANEANGTVTLTILDGSEAHEQVRLNADDVRKGDTVPPETERINVSSTTVPQGNIVELSGTVSDQDRGGTQIVSAHWNRTDPDDTDYGPTPMNASDGNFDQTVEDVRDIDIDTSSWQLGTHTLRLWGVDAAGNGGYYRNITVEVVEATSQSTIRGVVFQSRNDDSLSIYDYRDGSVHTTSRFAERTVGGIGDWDRDHSVTDIAYVDSNNDEVSVFDNGSGAITQTGVRTQGPISFFGDFDSDGEQDDIAYKNMDSGQLIVATYNETSDSVEERTVRRASTGAELLEIDRDPSHVTGAQDIDSDDNAEFAYSKNGNLYFAEVVEQEGSNIYVIVEETRTTDVDIEQIGDFADLDNDGIEDDVPITVNDDGSIIQYYDYSRDKLFQFASLNSDVDNIGGSIDFDGNGRQSLFFASDDTLHYTEVGSRDIVDTGIPAELVGGTN